MFDKQQDKRYFLVLLEFFFSFQFEFNFVSFSKRYEDSSTFSTSNILIIFYGFRILSLNRETYLFLRDKSGFISIREMKSLFRKLQIDATDKQIRNYFEKVDMDHNGEISFDEFVNEILPNFIRNDD